MPCSINKDRDEVWNLSTITYTSLCAHDFCTCAEYKVLLEHDSIFEDTKSLKHEGQSSKGPLSIGVSNTEWNDEEEEKEGKVIKNVHWAYVLHYNVFCSVLNRIKGCFWKESAVLYNVTDVTCTILLNQVSNE